MTDHPVSAPHGLDEQNNYGHTNLVCRWNNCLRVFPNHPSLASHLSEDHVGWKKGGYFCDWNNCARQGAKCHNRFALMMHLRIHTGEKPFECTVPECGQTFGRMDALVRHKKAEHGQITIDKPMEPLVIPTQHNPVPMHPPPLQPQHMKMKPNNYLDTLSKKRPQQHNGGVKRPHGYYLSDEESEDSMTLINKKNIPPPSNSADYKQYKLVKAQLHYILRENEMLQDEFDLAQKKLKRMRTERKVLLDAVMAQEEARHGPLQVEEEEEDEEEEDHRMNHIPNDRIA